MTIEADRIATLDGFNDVVALQRTVLGRRATIWSPSALSAVHRSGGLVLGARAVDLPGRPLHGALIDLHGEVDGYRARHTVFRGVHPEVRGRGIATFLRRSERAAHLRDNVALVTWEIDPLRSVDAHLALNKLGAMATGYRRNLYGDVHDAPNVGLATDRVTVEWWLEAPRVQAIVDRAATPPHRRLGLHEMSVLTETRVLPSGLRGLTRQTVEYASRPSQRFILVEIPHDLDRIRNEDVGLAKRWRLDSRATFELLFENGYVVVGLIHEGGRSFHLFERATRGDVLGRA